MIVMLLIIHCFSHFVHTNFALDEKKAPDFLCQGLKRSSATYFFLAAAAANGHVVHHQAAGTAVLQHTAEAIAAALDHFAALGITAGAG
jgi:hypothetical protein